MRCPVWRRIGVSPLALSGQFPSTLDHNAKSPQSRTTKRKTALSRGFAAHAACTGLRPIQGLNTPANGRFPPPGCASGCASCERAVTFPAIACTPRPTSSVSPQAMRGYSGYARRELRDESDWKEE